MLKNKRKCTLKFFMGSAVRDIIMLVQFTFSS